MLWNYSLVAGLGLAVSLRGPLRDGCYNVAKQQGNSRAPLNRQGCSILSGRELRLASCARAHLRRSWRIPSSWVARLYLSREPVGVPPFRRKPFAVLQRREGRATWCPDHLPAQLWRSLPARQTLRFLLARSWPASLPHLGEAVAVVPAWAMRPALAEAARRLPPKRRNSGGFLPKRRHPPPARCPASRRDHDSGISSLGTERW